MFRCVFYARTMWRKWNVCAANGFLSSEYGFYILCRTGALAGYHDSLNSTKLTVVAKIKFDLKKKLQRRSKSRLCTSCFLDCAILNTRANRLDGLCFDKWSLIYLNSETFIHNIVSRGLMALPFSVKDSVIQSRRFFRIMRRQRSVVTVAKSFSGHMKLCWLKAYASINDRRCRLKLALNCQNMAVPCSDLNNQLKWSVFTLNTTTCIAWETI